MDNSGGRLKDDPCQDTQPLGLRKFTAKDAKFNALYLLWQAVHPWRLTIYGGNHESLFPGRQSSVHMVQDTLIRTACG